MTKEELLEIIYKGHPFCFDEDPHPGSTTYYLPHDNDVFLDVVAFFHEKYNWDICGNDLNLFINIKYKNHFYMIEMDIYKPTVIYKMSIINKIFFFCDGLFVIDDDDECLKVNDNDLCYIL